MELSLIITLIIFFLTILILWKKKPPEKLSSSTVLDSAGKKVEIFQIPRVSGKLPIIGHLLQLSLYPESFMNSCYKTYGPVFLIHLGSMRTAIVCDRKLIKAVWNENGMSAADFFDRVQIQKGRHVSNDLFLHKMIKHLAVQKIDPELLTKYAENLVQILKTRVVDNGEKGIQLVDVFLQYAHLVFSHVIFGVDVSENPEIFESLQNYCYYSGLAAMSAFILPMPLITWLFEGRMHKPTPVLTACLQRHLADRNGRHEVDFMSDLAVDGRQDGKPLSAEELSEAFLRLNDTTIMNLALSMVHTLIHLNRNPDCLKQAQTEARALTRTKNYQGMAESELLTSYFMEATRLSTDYIGSTVRAKSESVQEIGNFEMRDLDFVMTGGHVINAGAAAEGVFQDEKRYKPGRWTGKEREIPAAGIGTFGGGRHRCPGKTQTLTIANVTLAHFLSAFELDMDQTRVREGMGMDLIRLIHVTADLKMIK